MIYSVSIDAAKPLLRLEKGYKRMLYTSIIAINQTGLQVQAAVREQVGRSFTVRKPEFIARQVKFLRAGYDIPQVGNRWEARVGIGIGKPLAGTPLLLPRFETGGERKGFKGGGVAIPVVGGARPAQAASVPSALFVQRLQLRRRTARGKRKPRPRAGQDMRQGLLGTFQLPAGIFQRLGDQVRALYLFKASVRLPARLEFYRTARRVIDTQFAKNMQRGINDSFARHG